MTDQTAQKRILFIDDDQDLTFALSYLLKDAGYLVRCAADGEEGLRMAIEEPPDLILLDFMMPVKDGFAVCVELQQIPALRDVPVIVLTAFGRNIGEIYGLHQQQVASYFRECLEKPVEPNVLLERVKSALADG